MYHLSFISFSCLGLINIPSGFTWLRSSTPPHFFWPRRLFCCNTFAYLHRKRSWILLCGMVPESSLQLLGYSTVLAFWSPSLLVPHEKQCGIRSWLSIVASTTKHSVLLFVYSTSSLISLFWYFQREASGGYVSQWSKKSGSCFYSLLVYCKCWKAEISWNR